MAELRLCRGNNGADVIVNHVRTLLLNLHATAVPTAGEQYVSASYLPVVLPTALQAARDALFGVNASRAAINLNLGRLLAFVHTSPLSDDVLASDSRLSYNPASPGANSDPKATTYNFVTAASVFNKDDAVFRRDGSVADSRWWDIWNEASAPAPTRAAALALALAARTQEVLLGSYSG